MYIGFRTYLTATGILYVFRASKFHRANIKRDHPGGQGCRPNVRRPGPRLVQGKSYLFNFSATRHHQRPRHLIQNIKTERRNFPFTESGRGHTSARSSVDSQCRAVLGGRCRRSFEELKRLIVVWDRTSVMKTDWRFGAKLAPKLLSNFETSQTRARLFAMKIVL